MLSDITVVPGLSDYKAITFCINHSAPKNVKPPHKVHVYPKADILSIKKNTPIPRIVSTV